MIEALETFNRDAAEERGARQAERGWRIGVGVNYGVATVGDIGCSGR